MSHLRFKGGSNLVCADEIRMENSEATNKPDRNETVDYKCNGSRSFDHCFPN